MKNLMVSEQVNALDALVRRVPAAETPPPSGFGAEAVFERDLLQHRRLFAEIASSRSAVCQAAALMSDTLRRGGRLLFFGNASAVCGSQHLAAEVCARLARGRWPAAAMAAVALSLDEADAVPPRSNGWGDPDGFARLIAAHAHWGDCAIAISTTGRSQNVLHGLQMARSLGVSTVGLLGRGDGPATSLVDVAVVVGHDDRARIHEAHIFIGHIWCDQIDSALGPL